MWISLIKITLSKLYDMEIKYKNSDLIHKSLQNEKY